MDTFLAHAGKELEKFGELGDMDVNGGYDVDVLLSTCRRDQ